MPLYKVKCTKCGRVYDDYFATKPTDRIIQKCECGGMEFQKLPTAPAVRFEGKDWATKKPAPAE